MYVKFELLLLADSDLHVLVKNLSVRNLAFSSSFSDVKGHKSAALQRSRHKFSQMLLAELVTWSVNRFPNSICRVKTSCTCSYKKTRFELVSDKS